MSRVTYYLDGKARFIIGNTEYSGTIPERLAAYENSGYEPEQLPALFSQLEALDAKVQDIIDQIQSHCSNKADANRNVDLAPQEETDGLKRKYIVFKSDNGEPVEGSFVLRPDKDPAARIALEAYARATENKELASDILDWVGDSGKVVVLPCPLKSEVYTIQEDYFNCKNCEHDNAARYQENIQRFACDMRDGKHCPYVIKKHIAEGFEIRTGKDERPILSRPGEWGYEGFEEYGSVLDSGVFYSVEAAKKYHRDILNQTRIKGMCCDCCHDKKGFCGDFAENTECPYATEDGSCWEPMRTHEEEERYGHPGE